MQSPLKLFLLAACCAAVAGCAMLAKNNKPPVPLDNPMFVPVVNADFAWDQIVDVVDDDFEIEREQRVRRVGEGWTEGRIDTFPLPAATYMDAWRRDSVESYDRLLATLQSMRRQCEVKVVPVEGGFLVEVIVNNFLEDTRPEFSPVEQATFRSDTSLQRISPGLPIERAPNGWIPVGRDFNLEQRILSKIGCRLQPMPPPQQSRHPLMH